MEELNDPLSECTLYGISFDSFLKIALELDIMKIKD